MLHRWIVVVVTALASVPPAAACERYYVLVFGSQRIPPNPRFAHSFAVFIKSTQSPSGPVIQFHTISWLAATGVVRLNTLLPERGENLDLFSSLNWAYGTGQRVSLWGPYEIRRKLYRRSVKQWRRLENGKMKYKAVDSAFPAFLATNCIHAVGTVASMQRIRVASPGWGETASYVIALRMRRWIINRKRKHLWLIPALRLDKYPIIYREMRNPRSGAIWTFVRELTGWPPERAHPTFYRPELPIRYEVGPVLQRPHLILQQQFAQRCS